MRFFNTKTFKALGALVGTAALISALALTGCGGNSGSSDNSAASSEDKTITVAAVPTPHAEILNDVVKPALEKEGYTLEVKEFNDYVQPNVAVTEGEADANYFQHEPYLDSYNKEKGTDLVGVTAVHYEPYGIYAGSKKSLDDIADGDKISVPNDTTNEARALLLLQQAGVITLKDGAGVNATTKDIAENPHNIKIVELEAAQIPRSLDDVAFAVINGNYAMEAGFTPSKDALVLEDANGEAAQTYANLLVTTPELKDSAKIQALASALTSDEVRDYINQNYEGAVLPIF